VLRLSRMRIITVMTCVSGEDIGCIASAWRIGEAAMQSHRSHPPRSSETSVMSSRGLHTRVLAPAPARACLRYPLPHPHPLRPPTHPRETHPIPSAYTAPTAATAPTSSPSQPSFTPPAPIPPGPPHHAFGGAPGLADCRAVTEMARSW
jgi:hypothetical protein